MSKEEIYLVLNEIFREVFMDDSIQLESTTCSKDIENWDSLMHMVLMSEIEKKFEIRFMAKEANSMKNVGELVDIIYNKL